MDEKVVQEMLDELFSSLEALETQNGAILQFLKKRGVAGDEDFAPFLDEAAKVSNVRWRATRIRVNHLLSNVPRATEKNKDQHAVQQSPEGGKNSEQPGTTAERTESDSKAERENAAVQQNSDNNQKVEESAVDKRANKDAA